jgi:hypothetical protein
LLYFALDITLKCALYRAGLTKVKFISLDFRQCNVLCQLKQTPSPLLAFSPLYKWCICC